MKGSRKIRRERERNGEKNVKGGKMTKQRTKPLVEVLFAQALFGKVVDRSSIMGRFQEAESRRMEDGRVGMEWKARAAL